MTRLGPVFGARVLGLLLTGTLLATAAGLTGCSALSSGDPPLSDSTFTRVIVELHLLSARTAYAPAPAPSARDSVFARYGVDRRAFEETLRYYSRHPAALEPLYASVLDSLNAIAQRARARHDARSAPDTSRAHGRRGHGRAGQ
jgi:hypothetical protein